MSTGNAGKCAMILLDGIDLEVLVLPRPFLGSCYRALAAECHKLHLLQAIVDPGTLTLDGGAVCDKAQSMANVSTVIKEILQPSLRQRSLFVF
jgi:hypothetical protein